jgi:vesicle coat complex subunit
MLNQKKTKQGILEYLVNIMRTSTYYIIYFKQINNLHMGKFYIVNNTSYIYDNYRKTN